MATHPLGFEARVLQDALAAGHLALNVDGLAHTPLEQVRQHDGVHCKEGVSMVKLWVEDRHSETDKQTNRDTET
jgi:hypothetical protein